VSLPNDASRYRWLVLAVFVLSTAINYLDRATLSALAPVLMDVPQMQEAARLGAFIEFVGGSLTGGDASARMDRFADTIRKVGPEFCILSSDLGQRGNALPPDGFGAFLVAMRARGFSDQDIARMSKQNPARLLGLN